LIIKYFKSFLIAFVALIAFIKLMLRIGSETCFAGLELSAENGTGS